MLRVASPGVDRGKDDPEKSAEFVAAVDFYRLENCGLPVNAIRIYNSPDSGQTTP
jgi:hypothetical protein